MKNKTKKKKSQRPQEPHQRQLQSSRQQNESSRQQNESSRQQNELQEQQVEFLQQRQDEGSEGQEWSGESGGENGFQIDEFLFQTLCGNKDRVTILKLEQEILQTFMADTKRSRMDFGGLTSYHRLIVHRVADYFHLDHSVSEIDGVKTVVLTKNPKSRM